MRKASIICGIYPKLLYLYETLVRLYMYPIRLPEPVDLGSSKYLLRGKSRFAIF